MKFGTDPEFVVCDSQNRPVPAHKVGIRTKKKKHVCLGGWGSFFRDGYAVELNVAPTSCRQSLTLSVQRGLQSVYQHLQKYGYHLETLVAVSIDLKKDMFRAPVDVKQFGCEPSYCAHDLVTKVPPIDALTHPYRYAGAHLHFSADRADAGCAPPRYDVPWLNDPGTYPDIIKLLDQYVGLPLTCLYHSPEQYLRRRFYGQAGEYRPQQYTPGVQGLEYRTPGPELWDTPWLSSLILGIARDVILRFPVMRKTLQKHRVAAVRHAIDTGESRWKLLRSTQYAPASMWKPLASALRQPQYRGPQCLALSNVSDIMDGFRGWRLNNPL